MPLLSLACAVVQRALRNLPYTVRWWWNNQIARQRDRVFVEKFIVKHLSSKLAAEELGSVKLREGVDDNVTVRIFFLLSFLEVFGKFPKILEI